MTPSCRTCSHWTYRLQTVAGVKGHYPGCAKWSGYFPDNGKFCPTWIYEAGTVGDDDVLD